MKGHKDQLAERCSPDCSSSDEEAGSSEGKPSVRKQDRKVPAPRARVPPSARSMLSCRLKCLRFVWLQPGASKLSPELSELVVYTCSVPFKGFEQAAERPAAEMSSFSESKALRLIKDSGMTSARSRPAESDPSAEARDPTAAEKVVSDPKKTRETNHKTTGRARKKFYKKTN